jgi:branched-chain amino acid transport system permease protein
MGWPAFRVGAVRSVSTPSADLDELRCSRTGFYYLVLIALAAALVFCWTLVRSPFGAVLRGIRENEAKTLALGYNTRLYKIAVVALAYLLGGLAGALLRAICRICQH